MAGPLDTIVSQIKDLFSSSGKSAIGIDIGSSSVKIVQLRKKGGSVLLETYGEIAVGPYAGESPGRVVRTTQEKVVEAITDLLREAKITSRDAGVAIPTSSSFVTFIKIPKVDSKQLAQIVPMEARKYVPVPLSEVTLDWLEVPELDDPYSEYEIRKESTGMKMTNILMVVIHNEALQSYKTITNLAKINSSFFEIEIFSALRSVADETQAAQLVIDFGANSTKYYILEQGVLRSTYIVNRGAQEISLALSQSMGITFDEAERLKTTVGISDDPQYKPVSDIIHITLDHLFFEAERSVSNFGQKYGKNIKRVSLTGGGSLLKGLYELARERFPNTEVVYADPFSHVQVPKFLEPVVANIGPSFAIAVGIALRKISQN